MKTLVVYRSHYGSTRRYAQWLAQALDADAAEERQADARLVQNSECVIFGGGLYAGSIAGAARMAKLYGCLLYTSIFGLCALRCENFYMFGQAAMAPAVAGAVVL